MPTSWGGGGEASLCGGGKISWMSAITSQYAETFADDAEQKQRANLEHLKVVVPRGLLHRVAGEGTKRLLHDEYGVDDIL
jgi:hypothetical protein